MIAKATDPRQIARRMAYDYGGSVVPNPGGQAQFARDWDHHIVALEGGWDSGKSYIGSRKLVTLHVLNALRWVGDQCYRTFVPSCAVAPTYGNAMDFCVPNLEDALTEMGLKWQWRGYGPIAQGRYSGPAIEVKRLGTPKRPSIILIRTADRPEGITGWEVGAAWGDEPARWREDRIDPRRDAFIQITGRVRHPKAQLRQIMLTYTNEGDATRVFEQMHLGNPDRALYRAPTKENPHAEEFLRIQLEALTSEMAEQYLGGGAMNLRGKVVYPSFERNLHLVKRVKLIPELPLHLSLDFNIEPGMHGEIGQYDEVNDVFLTAKELYGRRWSVVELLDELERWVGRCGGFRWPELHVFGDPMGKAEWAGTGQSCYYIITERLKQLGWPFRIRVLGAAPPVADRVNAVNLALLDIHGRTHYKIHEGCERLIEDFLHLHYDKFGEIQKTDRKLSHASDAEGYRISYLRPARVRIPTPPARHNVTVG